MSVDCYLDYKNGFPSKSFPVAAAGTFFTYWEKPAEEIGLTLVASFSNFLDIDEKELLLEVIGEVEKLQEYWREAKEIPYPNRFQGVPERIEKLLAALKAAYQEWDTIDSISIG